MPVPPHHRVVEPPPADRPPYGADLFEAPHLAVAYLLGVAMVWGVHRQRSRSEPTRFSCRPDLELTGQGVPSAARGVA